MVTLHVRFVGGQWFICFGRFLVQVLDGQGRLQNAFTLLDHIRTAMEMEHILMIDKLSYTPLIFNVDWYIPCWRADRNSLRLSGKNTRLW